ncbi:zf-ZPR1-domain-containing protein [Epithele typhae]|uniref:zf-ZPR1-domain-containing protein n=1 Tax=Epithele typhae TaxID=378194 RepID=UPI0020088037|nr:zf-ZPR1-domain-containing protein [Epithele typhae]KAH9935888.1 zf-ZPR1-domain-containing protein [Epithele typhae]
MSIDPTLFPSIGSVADQTERLPVEAQAVDVTLDEERPVQEIESLCMRCENQGMTRLLLTTIPYFREVIVMSFRCEHCGFANNEVQSAGAIRPDGAVYTVRVLGRDDLDRQIVKSNSCTVIIPEWELTIPPGRGQLTTIEGLIRDIITDLSADQTLRRVQNPVAYEKIESILDRAREAVPGGDDGEEDEASKDEVGPLSTPKKASQIDVPLTPFTVKLDDPAGNSFAEFAGSMADPKWNMRTYHRTKQHNIELGLVASDEPGPEAVAATEDEERIGGGLEGENEEIYIFPGTCSSCGHPSDTLVKKVNIPYFKDILIMSTSCDKCGYRDNEVKSGAAISEQGKRITLEVEDREDLSRDILKSETCGLSIPDIELVLQAGTLGGRFTTLEGILDQVYEELSEKVFASGDAVDDGHAFENFLKKLKAVKNAEHPFTLILDDPLANSHLQNLYAPDPDPNMTIEMYDRTWDQNEELGLNDMKVENYEEDAEPPKEGAQAATA